MYFNFIHRKFERRKWTLLVLEETEIERYVFCIKHLTDLKPIVIDSFQNLDFSNYEVCMFIKLFDYIVNKILAKSTKY